MPAIHTPALGNAISLSPLRGFSVTFRAASNAWSMPILARSSGEAAETALDMCPEGVPIALVVKPIHPRSYRPTEQLARIYTAQRALSDLTN